MKEKKNYKPLIFVISLVEIGLMMIVCWPTTSALDLKEGKRIIYIITQK